MCMYKNTYLIIISFLSPVVCIEFVEGSISAIESDGLVTINLIKNGSSLENITVFITVMLQDPFVPPTQSKDKLL